MKSFNVEEYRKALKKSEIALVGTPVRGSLIYLPNGFKIREKMYGMAIELLKQMGFKQILLSDLIDYQSLKMIDPVSKLSNNYFRVEGTDFCMTAGHEISCYLLFKELLKDHSKEMKLPAKYFSFGPVFRAPKNTRFPFNYGERKSFLECYAIYPTTQEAFEAIDEGVLWNRKIVKDILHLPGVEVERPIATNKQISQKSIHIDTITPLGETIITGMTYFHNDVFTKALRVKYRRNEDGKNYYVYSIHFGLSENVLHSYLINCYHDNGFRFFSFLAPTQVAIVDATCGKSPVEYGEFCKTIENAGFCTEVMETNPKKINKIVNSNFEDGIPVVVVFKIENNELKVVLCTRENESTITMAEAVEAIRKAFKVNDEAVVNYFEESEKNAIVECHSIEEIIETVADSKVAMFYCEKSDDNVKQIEESLQGGEVLGFSISETKGIDLISGNETNIVAYASRRS